MASKVWGYLQAQWFSSSDHHVFTGFTFTGLKTLWYKGWNIPWELGQYQGCWCPDTVCYQVIYRHAIGCAWWRGLCLPWWRIQTNFAIPVLIIDSKCKFSFRFSQSNSVSRVRKNFEKNVMAADTNILIPPLVCSCPCNETLISQIYVAFMIKIWWKILLF